MTNSLIFREGNSTELPTDNILVIDPCYVFGHIDEVSWEEFCNGFFDTNDTNGACLLSYKGIDILVCNTAHGDGEYTAYASSFLKGDFSVDAGLFCFIPHGEAARKAPELLPFFNAQFMDNGELTFSPTCACVLTSRAGTITAVSNGCVEGVINVDTEYDTPEDIVW